MRPVSISPPTRGRSPNPVARAAWIALVAAIAWAGIPARARTVTLRELLDEPRMTPKRFASNFDDFDFEAHDEVQAPDEFLGSRKGDCDDYAILADYVLSRKNYHTRLIFIRLVGRVAHAICYVNEDRAYLDYNNRIFFVTLERCRPHLREIADHVGDYVQANWTSVSQFTYTYKEDRKHFLLTVVKTDPPDSDIDRDFTY
ncbi:MAG TPA: transglutaminase-like domain-containing protein [Opitutus sp.]|nr:transglutaminase-like domain-containing protein [Opitutus sp.]